MKHWSNVHGDNRDFNLLTRPALRSYPERRMGFPEVLNFYGSPTIDSFQNLRDFFLKACLLDLLRVIKQVLI